jgi:formylglycine-generating enzyme required for sulfatase activity
MKRASIEGSNRVVSGGSWNNDANNCRTANRNNNIGFRLVFVP